MGRSLNGEASLHPDLGDLLMQSQPQQLRLRKVKSHQDSDNLEGMDLWDALGNNFADTVAKSALKQDFAFLKDAVQGMHAYTLQQLDFLHLYCKFLVELSEAEWELKKQVNVRVQQALAVTSENHAGHPVFMHWEQQFPCPGTCYTIPDMALDWALAASSPPWYTHRLWSWLQGLEWSDAGQRSAGVTSLELLVDFVACTGSCPPVRATRDGEAWTELRNSTLAYPITLQEWGQALMKSIRQLERLTGIALIPAGRTKVYTLRPLGIHSPRHGLVCGPCWRSPSMTFGLLAMVIETGDIQPLLKHCSSTEASVPDRDANDRYVAMSTRERDALARWLRRIR